MAEGELGLTKGLQNVFILLNQRYGEDFMSDLKIGHFVEARELRTHELRRGVLIRIEPDWTRVEVQDKGVFNCRTDVHVVSDEELTPEELQYAYHVRGSIGVRDLPFE